MRRCSGSWGSRAFVCDTSADKLSARAIPYVFLGFPPDALGWQFYHPTLCCVFPSQDVMFDESVPFYRLFPYHSAPPLPPLLFLAPGPPPVDHLPPRDPAPSRVSKVDPLPGAEPGGAESEGGGSGGAEPAGVEPGGAELEGVEPGGAESEGAEPRGTTSSGGPTAAGAGDSAAGGAGVTAGAGGAHTRETSGAGVGGTGTGGAVAVGAGAAGTGARGAGAGGAGRVGAQGAVSGGTGAVGRRVSRPHPPPVPSTHAMALRPSSVPLRVPLPPPLESSLLAVLDPKSERARAASPNVSCLLATAASPLVAELSSSPPSVRGECALVTDVLEDRQEDFEFLAAAVPRFASMLLAPEGDPDAPDIPTPRSYEEAITVPPSRANIVDGMWIFRVKRPPRSLPAFKARYVARGFSQRQGVDYFQNFSPTPKTTTLRVLLHVAAQRDNELHSLDFCKAFFLRRPVYELHQAPRKWHNTMRTTLAALGFTPNADPSLFLRTDPSLTPFYVLVSFSALASSSPQPTPMSTGHSLSAPPSDESVEPSGPYPELVGCLVYLMTCTRPDLAYPRSLLARYVGPGPVVLTGHADASWVDHLATQRSSQGYFFSLGSGSVSWQSTRSSLVLSSICVAEIFAGDMAAQELSWLTYLLTDLGEQPRLPPVLYVDNKAMIALCQEKSLEHRMKHIALRYFLARELQQCGQLCLAYVSTNVNTADIFIKALPHGDHQSFSTMLGLVPTLPHLLTA
ncbi:unnamed protein product [Closterium sp. NIES-53]